MIRSIPKQLVALTFITACSLITSGNVFADIGDIGGEIFNRGRDACVETAQKIAKDECNTVTKDVKRRILACCDGHCTEATCGAEVAECLGAIALTSVEISDDDAATLAGLFGLD